MLNIDWKIIDNNTPEFSLNNFNSEGKIVSVYDGDSVHIVLPLNLIKMNDTTNINEVKLYKFNCRLNGLDTPEIRTKNIQEKEFGLKVRDILRDKILNKIVKVKCGDFDKYGRLLVDIYLEDLHINKWLIDNGYANNYDGGKKTKWFI